MLGLLARRRGSLAVALLLSTCVLGGASIASAQGITLNRFSPAETVRDGFVLSRPEDRGHGRFGFDLQLDYANDPLVLELDPGNADSEDARVVSDQLSAHIGLWVSVFERLVLFAGIDVNLLMRGESFRDPQSGDTIELADGTSLGDGRFGLRLRLFGERDDVFATALQFTVSLPLAEVADDAQNFAGESSATLLPELLLELRPGILRITANAGIGVRENTSIGQVALEEELRFGLGFSVWLVEERLDLLAEAYGSTSLEDFGDREASPLEFLVGPKYWFGTVCAGGLAGGAGLQRGVGSPDFRTVLSFGCDLPEEEPEIEAPPSEIDSDGDGLLDPGDRCPTRPEDKDDFEDSDGCPDPDNDNDGVLDRADGCALDPEDKDSFEDDDGCPDPDNDKDGVLDADDGCPLEPEDADNFEDADGCPDPDNDKDSVLDTDDRCPTVPGTAEEQGCPKRIRVEEDRIVILEAVEFATNKDVILDRSEPILAEVADTLAANPQIKLMRIEGHTDARGRDRSNMELSRRRAGSVARWLHEHGIELNRLEAYGCGENRPVDSNTTDAGRQKNRRVDFLIIEPSPSGGARSTEGCEPQGL